MPQQDSTPNTQKFTAYSGTGERIASFDPNGNVLASHAYIEALLSDATAISLLTTNSNWSSAGVYVGSAITGTYGGQFYYDSNFYFFAVANNSWIRLPRTSYSALHGAVQSTTTTDTFTHNSDNYVYGKITALSQSLTMAAPTGTPVDMQEFIMYIKPDSGSESISWNAAFSGDIITLPTSTGSSGQMEMHFRYNSSSSKWELVKLNPGKKSVQVVSSTGNFYHDNRTYTDGKITALAVSLTMEAPLGTAIDGEEFTMLIKDNGTSRSITWNSVFDSTYEVLPTQTSPSVGMKLKFRYNSTTSKWELLSVTWKKTIQSTTSTSTFTHDCRLYTHGKLTAQAASLTMAAPVGTAIDMQEFVMYIKDNGTSRSISWNAAFSGVMAALPSSTTVNKQMVFFFVYNSTTSKWELMNTATEV